MSNRPRTAHRRFKAGNRAPVINPAYEGDKVEVYHPTKGWRYQSPKRMRAGALMVGPLRGWAVAKLISEGHQFGP